MTMRPALRKFVLTIHIVSSVGFLGAAVAYLALAVVAQFSGNTQTVRAAWIAMELIGWYAIVPLALSSLVIGLVNALGTSWGLFRHYWVLFKLLLTVFAVTILLLHMPTVSATAEIAADADRANLSRLGGDVLHSGGGVLVLLIITVLSVYKPRGLTPYGWRKQHEQRRIL